jgi:hypothetical protein
MVVLMALYLHWDKMHMFVSVYLYIYRRRRKCLPSQEPNPHPCGQSLY